MRKARQGSLGKARCVKLRRGLEWSGSHGRVTQGMARNGMAVKVCQGVLRTGTVWNGLEGSHGTERFGMHGVAVIGPVWQSWRAKSRIGKSGRCKDG